MSATGQLRYADGRVAAGYEAVRAVFEDGLAEFGAGGGSFAAYVRGELVVDLWGGQRAPGQPWARDTLAVLMSATKGLATVCAQMLADDGLLDTEAPVAEYWPEFDRPDKAGILVRHVLTHTSGILGLGPPPLPVRWDGAGWDDYDAIAAAVAAAPVLWRPGERYGYHALTYGWMIGELVRRFTGVTIGRFFRERVADPLGLDAWIGTPSAEDRRVALVAERLTAGMSPAVRLVYLAGQRRLRDPATLCGQAYLASDGRYLVDTFGRLINERLILSAELPFGGATATARSVARLYSVLAEGGGLDGVRLLSPEVIERFRRVQVAMPDAVLLDAAPAVLRRFIAAPVRRTLGYLVNPSGLDGKALFGPNPAAYGHDGAGGQLAFCDPDARIGVGFLRSELTSSPVFSRRLLGSLYSCAGAK
jgi:CubicO group peptidase (beta-lactamase class C family)